MKVLLKADGRTTAGGATLIVHNERLADPLDEFTRAIAAISKKRSKTEADHTEIGRLECAGGLYTFPAIQGPADLDGQLPCMPAINILRCLQEGATLQKRGRDVLRGIYPLAEQAELVYDGPHDPVGIWQQGQWLRKTVGVQKRRVPRVRPWFVDWQLELPMQVDDNIFDLHTLKVCWHNAGIYVGLGEMRPVYGRFAGTIDVTDTEKTTKGKAKQ